MTSKTIYRVLSILASIGILLAVYLLWQQLFRPPFHPCSINATVNCDAIIKGPVAKTLGIPTPLYGLVGYIVIFFAVATARKKLLMGMATFGLIFCLYIGYRELFELRTICPVCIGCQLDMITVFILSLIVQKKKD
jgi:uncharacterized membrane protein